MSVDDGLDKESSTWLRYAEEDLATAEAIVGSRLAGVLRQACFLAQQAAEKALKSVLVGSGIDFPKRPLSPRLAMSSLPLGRS